MAGHLTRQGHKIHNVLEWECILHNDGTLSLSLEPTVTPASERRVFNGSKPFRGGRLRNLEPVTAGQPCCRAIGRRLRVAVGDDMGANGFAKVPKGKNRMRTKGLSQYCCEMAQWDSNQGRQFLDDWIWDASAATEVRLRVA